MLADAVVAYCVHMHNVGLAPKTITGRLVVISFEAQASGLPDTCKDFRKALEGWAKATRRRWGTRLPVSACILQQLIRILPVVCSFPFEALLYKAVFLIAFFGAFRVEE